MKKKLVLILCFIILSGCGEQKNIAYDVKTQLTKTADMAEIPASNMDKKYYSYYLPAGIVRKESTDVNEVFRVDQNDLVMNFNTANIVINKFYKESPKVVDTKSEASKKAEIKDLEKVTYKKGKNGEYIYKGYYENNHYQTYPYSLVLIKNKSNDYLMHLNATIVDFYSVLPSASISSSLKIMMKLAKSIEYKSEVVLNDYSMKQIENSKKENLDFLTKNFPEEGYLNEVENKREESPIK
ncbi:MAG: hypothetical protein RSF69_04870 [Erysipelotrichaceae bacterium]